MNGESKNAERHSSNIELCSEGGDTAVISPYAAHVLSWKNSEGADQLFLSPKADFREGAAIRGGVPVIFPQFAGLGSLPKHGFARTSNWIVNNIQKNEVFFTLSANDQTRSVWPYSFQMDYHIYLADGELSLELSLKNNDVTPFSFTSALHTYFRVKDSSLAYISGLQGLVYQDSADGDVQKLDKSKTVTFPSEVDRIYREVPGPLTLVDGERMLRVSAKSRFADRQRGFRDAVIWNPGPEKCARLADMLPAGYLQFVCIESAAAASPVFLQPGENWFGSQNITIIKH